MSGVSGPSYLRSMPAIALRSGVTDEVKLRIDERYVSAIDDLREHLGSLSQEVLSKSLIIALLTAADVHEYPLRAPVARYAVQKAHQFIPMQASENEQVEYWCVRFLPERVACHYETEIDPTEPYGLYQYVMQHPMQFLRLFDDDLTAEINRVIVSGALEEIEQQEREAQAQQQHEVELNRCKEMYIERLQELHKSHPGVINEEFVNEHFDQFIDDLAREFPLILVKNTKESLKKTMLDNVKLLSKQGFKCVEADTAFSGLDDDVALHFNRCIQRCLLYDEHDKQLPPVKINGLMKANDNNNAYQWDPQAKLWICITWSLTSDRYFRAYCRALADVRDECDEMMSNQSDPVERKKLETTYSSIVSLLKKMKTVRFAKLVSEKLRPLLHDRQFLDGLDPITTDLPTADGLLVNVFTGQSRNRTIKDLYTKCLHVSYQAEVGDDHLAAARDFFMKLCCYNEEHYHYFMQILAVYISGYMADKSMFIGWGTQGNNGKSTLLNLLQSMIGDYFSKISKDVIVKSTGKSSANAHTAQLMPLVGRRLCACSELASGDVLDTSRIKELTGMEDITIRPLYGDVQVVPMRSHIMLFTNVIGALSDVDKASLGRLAIFPMNAVFAEEYVNNESTGFYGMNKLMGGVVSQPAFLTAAFRLIIEGGKSYCAAASGKPGVFGSFTVPDDVVALREQFGEDRFPYQDFIDTYYEVGTKDYPVVDRVLKSQMWKDYQQWCILNSVKFPTRQQTFNSQISLKYYCNKSDGNECYYRLKRRAQEKLPQPATFGVPMFRPMSRFIHLGDQPVKTPPQASAPARVTPVGTPARTPAKVTTRLCLPLQ